MSYIQILSSYRQSVPKIILHTVEWAVSGLDKISRVSKESCLTFQLLINSCSTAEVLTFDPQPGKH